MSFEPITRAIVRYFVRVKIRNMDAHIASLNASIDNDHRALRELHRDRALLARRLS